MGYRIRYAKSAKEEADYLRATYGQTFRAEFDQWLADLAEAAESRALPSSGDILEILSEIDRTLDANATSEWKFALKKIASQSVRDQLRACIAILKNRCPPWQLRGNEAWFTLLDSIEQPISTYFIVDHQERQVIFYLFELGDHKAGLDD